MFGDKLDDVFVGAANGAMDYIAYVDETWTPEDDEDRKRTLETEAFHLESLKAVLEIAEKNGLSVRGRRTPAPPERKIGKASVSRDVCPRWRH